MFQSVRTHWQLNSCSAVHKHCVLRHTAVYRRRRREVNMESGEKTTFVQKMERIQRQKSEGQIVVRRLRVSRHELE